MAKISFRSRTTIKALGHSTSKRTIETLASHNVGSESHPNLMRKGDGSGDPSRFLSLLQAHRNNKFAHAGHYVRSSEVLDNIDDYEKAKLMNYATLTNALAEDPQQHIVTAWILDQVVSDFYVELRKKIDKVYTAVPGNFPLWGDYGVLVDGNCKPSDFALKDHRHGQIANNGDVEMRDVPLDADPTNVYWVSTTWWTAVRKAAIEFYNTLTVDGKVTINGGLEVKNDQTTQLGSTTVGTESVNKNLTVNGNETVSGTMKVAGATTVSGSMTVEGSSTLNNSLKVTTGGIDVTGDSKITGNFEVTGTTKYDDNVEIGGTLTVDKKTTLKDELSVTKDTSISGNLTVANDKSTTVGSLTVGKADTANDTSGRKNLTVNGDSSIVGDESVGGNLSVTGTASATESVVDTDNSTKLSTTAWVRTRITNWWNYVCSYLDIAFSKKLTVTGLITANGGLTVANDQSTQLGATTVGIDSDGKRKDLKVTGDESVVGAFSVTGKTTLNGDLSVSNNKATQLGNTTIGENSSSGTRTLTVNGDIVATGSTTSKDSVVGKSTTNDGTLTVNGTSTFNGTSSFKDDVTIGENSSDKSKNLTVNGDSTVTGSSSVTGNSTVGGLMTANGGLTVKNDQTAQLGATTVGTTAENKDLTVNGNESVTGNLTVTGDETIGTTTDNKSLTVNGSSSVTGTSTVDGLLTANGGLTVNNGKLTQLGATTVGTTSANKNLTVNGNETVTGTATISGATTLKGDLTVDNSKTTQLGATTVGTTTTNKSLTVNGTESVTGDVTVGGNETVTGLITANGGLTVKDGQSTQLGATTVGTTASNRNLTVNGDATATGSVTGKTLVAGDSTKKDGSLTVNGTSSVTGDATVGGNETVTGTITENGTVADTENSKIVATTSWVRTRIGNWWSDICSNVATTVKKLWTFNAGISSTDVKVTNVKSANALCTDSDGKIQAKGVDTTPTKDSSNLITSGAVYSGLDGKSDKTHTHGQIANNGDVTMKADPADNDPVNVAYLNSQIKSGGGIRWEDWTIDLSDKDPGDVVLVDDNREGMKSGSYEVILQAVFMIGSTEFPIDIHDPVAEVRGAITEDVPVYVPGKSLLIISDKELMFRVPDTWIEHYGTFTIEGHKVSMDPSCTESGVTVISSYRVIIRRMCVKFDS